MVLDEMTKLSSEAMDEVQMLNAFPKARAALIEVVTNVLNEQHEKATEHISTFVDMNITRINYDHPDFESLKVMHELELRKFGEDEESAEEQELMQKAHSGVDLTTAERQRVRGIMKRRQRVVDEAKNEKQGAQTDGASSPFAKNAVRPTDLDLKLHSFLKTVSPQEQLEVQRVIALTEAYFDLFKKIAVDQVPKYIQFILIEHTIMRIEREVMTLGSDANVTELMSPAEDLKLRREQTIAGLEKLEEARVMLNQVTRKATLDDSHTSASTETYYTPNIKPRSYG